MQTPTLNADGGLVLRPISSGDLTDLLESYHESPEDGQTALPWMYPRNVAEQLADFVRDILRSAEEDRIHFWSIRMDDQHVGTIGLGDELQLDLSSWSLGCGCVSAIRASESPVGPSMRSSNGSTNGASKRSSKWPSTPTTDRGSPRPVPCAHDGAVRRWTTLSASTSVAAPSLITSI